jgi:hypothetical protein
MKAPEKLYFGESDKGILDIYSTKESDNEVEYTRTDAFVEKALRWMMNTDGVNYMLSAEMIEDFKNYMKGE